MENRPQKTERKNIKPGGEEMKKIAIVFGLLLALCFSCSQKKEPEIAQSSSQPAPKLTGPKKRVGIFAFKNKSRYGQDKLTKAAVDILYSELEKSGLFELYERADLEELEKEYDLIEAGKINLQTAAEPGKLVGVQAVIIGSITQFGIWQEAEDLGFYKKRTDIAEATVDVRLVDITTGKVIYADSGTGRVERETETVFGFGEKAEFDETMADKALRAAISKFIDNLIARIQELPWQGRVADVDREGGEEILYINAGRKSGMPMGARLVIYRVVGKVTDPETGAFLGYKTKKIGTAEVFDYSGEDLSLARFISGAGGAQRGDLVVLEQDAGKI